jgi:peptidoglycan/LPS O-acetylase OafA/YrhL
MYLVHFIFAFELSNFLLPKINSIVNENYTLLILYFIAVLCSFTLGLLPEKFVEKPFIKLGQKLILKIN